MGRRRLEGRRTDKESDVRGSIGGREKAERDGMRSPSGLGSRGKSLRACALRGGEGLRCGQSQPQGLQPRRLREGSLRACEETLSGGSAFRKHGVCRGLRAESRLRRRVGTRHGLRGDGHDRRRKAQDKEILPLEQGDIDPGISRRRKPDDRHREAELV